MRCDMPASRATERESAHDQAVLVDWIIFLHVIECFEEIGFTGEAIAIAITPVEMQHERIRGREFARRSLASIDEVEFRECFTATMKPKIEAKFVRRVGLK